MSEEKDSKRLKALRVNLSDDLSNDLKFIKKDCGIESDSEMIRFLIKKMRRIIEEEIRGRERT